MSERSQDTVSYYQRQLLKVNDALSSCTNPDERESLLKLQIDILEVLKLAFANSSQSDDSDTSTSSSSPSHSSSDSEFEDAVNEKVLAPFTSSNGKRLIFCAIVFKKAASKSKVLYLTPICNSMKTCEYFLNDSCSYGATCKYSHGVVIDNKEIYPFQQHCSSVFTVNTECLVNTDEALWMRGIIVKQIESNDQFVISLPEKQTEITVDSAKLMPYSYDVGENTDEDSCSSDNDEDYKPRSILIGQSSFGKWEEFTKGFGSKMLLKMGYKWGGGLGKNNEGLVNPVDALVYPTRMSLDACMNLRLQKPNAVKEVTKKSLPQSSKELKIISENEKADEFFNFVNNLNQLPQSSKQKESSSTKHSAKTIPELNKLLFSVQQKKQTLLKKLANYKAQQERNSCDTSFCGKVSESIRLVHNQLKDLNTEEFTISKTLKSKKSQLTLTQF